MSSTRNSTIDLLLSDLRKIRTASLTNSYAIKENIDFLEACRYKTKYIKWLLAKAKNIRGQNLLELSDLLMEKWDYEAHVKLVLAERKKFPGLIRPIVSAVVEFILTQNKSLFIANFGSGGMELERQLVIALLKFKYHGRLFIFCIDKSSLAQKVGLENLSNLEKQIDLIYLSLDDSSLEDNLKRSFNKKITVLICNGDILNFIRVIKKIGISLNLVYNSLMLHHLSEKQINDFDIEVNKITDCYFEYDGFRSLLQLIPQTFFSWFDPLLLNGAVFSNLRYISKKDAITRAKKLNGKIDFFWLGSYLIKKENQL